MYKDIRQVREHYAALRDLIARALGGRDDVATRSQVSVLCEAAIAALDDAETRQRLRAVDRHAAELFSYNVSWEVGRHGEALGSGRRNFL